MPPKSSSATIVAPQPPHSSTTAKPATTTAATATHKPKRAMQKPINALHAFLTQGQRVCVWLLHDNHVRFEGVLLGYDEFMNLVLGEAVETNSKVGQAAVATPLGRILLKGDTVGAIHVAAVGL